MPDFRYYGDFIILPLGIVFALILDQDNLDLLLLVAGVIGFTLVEYVFHRWVLHGPLWSSYHERHHQHPAEYVIFPWWYTSVLLLTAGVIIAAVLRLRFQVFIGFEIGLLWFFMWHHVLHHWDLRKHPLLTRYSQWHELHHKDLPANYGITHPVWDWMFGSFMSTDDGRRVLMKRAMARRSGLPPTDGEYY